MLPNLLVIGAAKSGTSSLHRYLGQHPDIFMSPVKEPNYFAFQGVVPVFAGPSEVGRPSFERDRLRREKYQFSVLDQPGYERLFQQAGNRSIRGESSAAYLYFPDSAARIKKAIPNTKIVAVLRHPAERAFSKYQQMRRDRAEPLDSFTAAIAAERQRKHDGWAPTWLYMDRGYYGRQLKVYFDRFDQSQIHIVLYDDLQRDLARCLRGIFVFLDVDPDVAIDTRERHNVSAMPQVPRFDMLYRTVAQPFLRSAHLQSLFPERLASRIRPLARRILLKPSAPIEAERLPSLEQYLNADLRADIEALQEMLGIDLSSWLGPTRPTTTQETELDDAHRLSG